MTMPDTGWAYMPQDDSVTIRPMSTAAKARVAVLVFAVLVLSVVLLVDVFSGSGSVRMVLV